jgi:carboxyl-terminal processing protease
VKVTISRENEAAREFSITRQEIKVKSVPYSAFVQDSIGYILLTSFTEDCSGEIKKAYNQLAETGKLKGLILDLRGNPGGLLYESVNIANFFIEKGEVIVKTRGRVQEWEKSYKGLNQALSIDIPLAILVNSGSASASEIVAGAIQDFDRGVIIGQRTFGKGLVQTTRNISYNSKIKVTTAKYYTPSGRCIQALDYSHRNDDGSVGKVPDSLTQVFFTKSGRKVFDGGGIKPDISTPEKVLSGVATALERNFQIFDFASRYVQKKSSSTELKNFKISDDDFELFISEMSGRKMDFETVSDKALKQLKRELKDEGYENETGQQMDDIAKAMEHSRKSALRQHADEIRKRAEGEIVSRYFYQKGRIEYNLSVDPEIDTAISVLQNPFRYKALLRGALTGNK